MTIDKSKLDPETKDYLEAQEEHVALLRSAFEMSAKHYKEEYVDAPYQWDDFEQSAMPVIAAFASSATALKDAENELRSISGLIKDGASFKGAKNTFDMKGK